MAKKKTPKPQPKFDAGKALGVKPTTLPAPKPDKVPLTHDLGLPEVKFQQKVDTPTIKAVPLSDGQQALETCGALYKRMAKDSPRVLQATAAMLGLRRMYAVAYRELQDAVKDATAAYAAQEPPAEIPPEFCDFAVQYAMYMASKPFNEHDLMGGVIGTLLPWMGDVVDRHAAVDEKAFADAQAAKKEKRKATPLPIDLSHTVTQDDPKMLARDRSLVLVGWKPAVAWLIAHACKTILAAEDGFRILHMATVPPKKGERDVRCINLPPNAWGACTNSDRHYDAMVGHFVLPSLTGEIDALVVDDLSLANTAGFIGRDPNARAGDAHKKMRKWCDGIGAGMLAALPQVSQTLPDFAGQEFEQLKTFALLRPVSVENTGEHYRLTVGNQACVIDVPKSEIDAYGSGSLIVPNATLQ